MTHGNRGHPGTSLNLEACNTQGSFLQYVYDFPVFSWLRECAVCWIRHAATTQVFPDSPWFDLHWFLKLYGESERPF